MKLVVVDCPSSTRACIKRVLEHLGVDATVVRPGDNVMGVAADEIIEALPPVMTGQTQDWLEQIKCRLIPGGKYTRL